MPPDATTPPPDETYAAGYQAGVDRTRLALLVADVGREAHHLHARFTLLMTRSRERLTGARALPRKGGNEKLRAIRDQVEADLVEVAILQRMRDDCDAWVARARAVLKELPPVPSPLPGGKVNP